MPSSLPKHHPYPPSGLDLYLCSRIDSPIKHVLLGERKELPLCLCEDPDEPLPNAFIDSDLQLFLAGKAFEFLLEHGTDLPVSKADSFYRLLLRLLRERIQLNSFQNYPR